MEIIYNDRKITMDYNIFGVGGEYQWVYCLSSSDYKFNFGVSFKEAGGTDGKKIEEIFKAIFSILDNMQSNKDIIISGHKKVLELWDKLETDCDLSMVASLESFFIWVFSICPRVKYVIVDDVDLYYDSAHFIHKVHPLTKLEISVIETDNRESVVAYNKMFDDCKFYFETEEYSFFNACIREFYYNLKLLSSQTEVCNIVREKTGEILAVLGNIPERNSLLWKRYESIICENGINRKALFNYLSELASKYDVSWKDRISCNNS